MALYIFGVCFPPLQLQRTSWGILLYIGGFVIHLGTQMDLSLTQPCSDGQGRSGHEIRTFPTHAHLDKQLEGCVGIVHHYSMAACWSILPDRTHLPNELCLNRHTQRTYTLNTNISAECQIYSVEWTLIGIWKQSILPGMQAMHPL